MFEAILPTYYRCILLFKYQMFDLTLYCKLVDNYLVEERFVNANTTLSLIEQLTCIDIFLHRKFSNRLEVYSVLLV